MDELIPNLRDERVQGAVKSLLVYSIVILLVPLGSMFFLKRYLFEELFGYSPNDSLTYSAVIAVILVHVVLLMQKYAHDLPVHLGFANRIETDELYRLRRTADLQCNVCQKQMCFLIQVYATSENDPPHSFHRTLFVFVCRNPLCSKSNDASNMVVFRCCLPRLNPYYSFDGPMDPDLDGDVPDPRMTGDAPQLCVICGCFASKKCGKCSTSWYCCRDHQALDWTSGHKQSCGNTDNPEGAKSLTNPLNKFLFKEYGIEMDQEYVPAELLESLNDGDSEDDFDDKCADDDDESEDIKRKRMEEFEDFVAKNKLRNDQFKTDEMEAAVCDQRSDFNFERFNRLLNLNSEQVLRYQRSGTPLLATDRAPPPGEIPSCEICGAPRTFELQLMPHLLSLIDVDDLRESIDWASVYIFTCSRSCEIENNGYAKEYVFKQDFS
ncbi:hypothetical protein RB195_010889 [Necator americanus]|uniref:MYND-type domain-containing protein n=1 Tax=Necator americanus TaxID=51031 RepID=A0ABR1D0R2_NECAM